MFLFAMLLWQLLNSLNKFKACRWQQLNTEQDTVCVNI